MWITGTCKEVVLQLLFSERFENSKNILVIILLIALVSAELKFH